MNLSPVPEPPARRVYLHPGADAEVAEAIRYYEAEEEGLGAKFEAEVVRTVELILKAPESAPIVRPKGVRWKVMQRFPYSLVYAVEPDRIRIMTIAHQRRRPGYCVDRV